MVKKIFFGIIFCLIISGIHAQNTVPAGIEISFDYNRRSGTDSNQFAVWIEDNEGKMVRTLFVTRYTAAGGWEKRPLSIPLWVKQSEIASLSKKEIDAFTGATPRSSTNTLKYRWDGTDKNGNRAAAGEYRIFLEATLRNENRVLYSASFTLGGSTAPETMIRTQYFGSRSREQRMIENVQVFYTP
jgi:hypothetical protein